MQKQNKTINKPRGACSYSFRYVATQTWWFIGVPYLLRAFYERLKDNVERVVVAVMQTRVRARHVRVVVARLPRGPRVPPRQRAALAHQYVVVASMSLHPNNHTR